MEEVLSLEDNEIAIKFWKQVNDRLENIFMYGHKPSGTKPGNVAVHNKLVKGREKLSTCLAVREYLKEQENEKIY